MMREKRLLIAGGLGFLGFNAIQLWKKENPELQLYAIDAELHSAYAAQEKVQWLKENGVGYFKCDICDRFAVEALAKQFGIEAVINFADVRDDESSQMLQANVIGTQALLEIAQKNNLRFHQVSTIEAYGQKASFSTKDKQHSLQPISAYGASKAAAEILALAAFREHKLNVTVSRCPKCFGSWMPPDSFISLAIRKALKDENVVISGDMKADWIHADEHSRAVMKILEEGEAGKAYDIAPPKRNCISDRTLAEFALKQLKKPASLLSSNESSQKETLYENLDVGFCQTKRLWKEDMKNVISQIRQDIERKSAQ